MFSIGKCSTCSEESFSLACLNLIHQSTTKMRRSWGNLRPIGEELPTRCHNTLPINVALFSHLRKHCCGKKICLQESKNVFQHIISIFVAVTMFPSLLRCFQMFPARETLFSRLDMLKQCFRTVVQT